MPDTLLAYDERPRPVVSESMIQVLDLTFESGKRDKSLLNLMAKLLRVMWNGIHYSNLGIVESREFIKRRYFSDITFRNP